MVRVVLISQEAGRPRAVERALAGAVGISYSGFAAGGISRSEAQLEGALRAADIVLVTHVLMDEGADRIAALLDRHLTPRTTLLVLNSLLPLLKKTRLGNFRLDGGMTLPFSLEGDLTESFQKLLREAPRLLAALPPSATDLKAFVRAMVYWNEPSPRNLAHLVFMLADLYGGRGDEFQGRWSEPELFPRTALYHPDTGVTENLEAMPPRDATAGTLGVLLQRGAVLAQETGAIDAAIRLFEARGLRVLAAFSDSFDFREPIERWFDAANVDAYVSLTGFPLVGGHNRAAPEATSSFLKSRNRPYFTPAALMMQGQQAFDRSRIGLLPMETAMQVAIHELEGGIEPLVIHTMAADDGGEARQLLEERASRFADRLQRWIALRRKSNAEKRVALVVFAFPPGKGAVGTAAYLDVFRSVYAVLARLKAEGYTIDMPTSAESLLRRLVESGDPETPISAAEIAVADRLSLANYERIAPEHVRAEKLWGPAPGVLNTDGRDLLIPGLHLGNVFLGVQPSFGFDGDPLQLLFDQGAAPHHGFIAFYRWIERIFHADAVVHVGTHGALEFMPGKQVGLSARCWPDLLTGVLPDIYLYAVNNPSEGTIAKRRGYAVTIGHLTPPAEEAGLYNELRTVKDLVAEYREAEDGERRRRTAETLLELITATHLDSELGSAPPLHSAEFRSWIAKVHTTLTEIEARRIPIGLHTIGRHPEDAEIEEILVARWSRDKDDTEAPRLLDLLKPDVADEREAITSLLRPLAKQLLSKGAAAVNEDLGIHDPRLAGELSASESLISNLRAGDEIGALVNALAGGYVFPGPGGDPVRAPEVVPTGRNLHALDPAAVPSFGAERQAAALVKLLLARALSDRGEFPRSIGFVLWGLDNIKTRGEGIAQVLALLGVRARRNSIGRVTRLEVIPLSELGRPRIDVTISVSGIFRDIFGLQMELLDRAVRLVADLDEPLDWNFVRARSLQLEQGDGFSRVEARTRLFSNAPGAYGTYIDHLVSLGRWQKRSDLAESFVNRKGFAYTSTAEGENSKRLLATLAKSIDVTFQNVDSAEVSLTDVDHYFEYLGGMTALVEREKGTAPDAYVGDDVGPHLRVRSLKEAVRLEARTKLLNPKWYEGMLRHGFEGAEEIRKRLDYAYGWSATANALDAWVYEDAHQSFVADPNLRKRLEAANFSAYHGLVDRLIEAADREFWSPDAVASELLLSEQSRLSDATEGIA